MARKYDFTRTVKGTKVVAKVYDVNTDEISNKEIIIPTTTDAKDFKKVLVNALAPYQLLKVVSTEDYTKLFGWYLDEIIPMAHELENRNGKEVDA